MRKGLAAHEAFYPAAAAYAALLLPVSVLALTGLAGIFPGVREPVGHAHEMLFGFALAVVAGNQLGAASSGRVLALLFIWAAARAAFLAAPSSLLADILNAAFAGGLAVSVVPRLFASAKKMRNRALPAVLASLCVAAVAWQVARHTGPGAVQRIVVPMTVVLFAWLMLFMGGRIIPAAVAGQLHRQGEPLQARVQPRVEAALILSGVVALAALAAPGGHPLAALALAVAGALAAARLVRWRLWALRGRADLLCLAAGYAWLCAGLFALSLSIAFGRYASAALHVITVGALGTLTLNVMAQSWLLKARRAAEGSSPHIVAATALLGAATVLRVYASFSGAAWLLAAAGCWALAFALLLLLFLRSRYRSR